jgi:hypothetical protein
MNFVVYKINKFYKLQQNVFKNFEKYF